MGRICTDTENEQTKFTCAYFFVEQYGLLGFMVDAPLNTDFMLNDEVTLKDNNIINKNCVMKTKDYFDLFFPFASNEEMSYTITNGKVVIESKSDLQQMLKHTSLNNQLIYSNFYCEKIDWFVEYANIVVKSFMLKIQKLNMILVNVEIKLMYIKVEIRTKILKNNC